MCTYVIKEGKNKFQSKNIQPTLTVLTYRTTEQVISHKKATLLESSRHSSLNRKCYLIGKDNLKLHPICVFMGEIQIVVGPCDDKKMMVKLQIFPKVISVTFCCHTGCCHNHHFKLAD